MDLGIEGRVALITGAGRGIGRQIALTLAEEGCRVAVNDLFQERAEAVAGEVEAAGGDALAAAADVTDADAVASMVATIADRWGGVDILANNAGIAVEEGGAETGGFAGPFQETTPAQWQRAMGVITQGVLHVSHAVLPGMQERGWGRIVSIISDAGRVGEPRLVAYAMAKAGVVGFSKSLARESGRYGITVNCVSPATTETDATKAWLEAQGERIMRQYPMARSLNRLGRPTDIADAVAFLASQRAEWITGQVLSVNGGFSMVD